MTTIKTANFVISNPDYKLCPSPNIPEYAFIGRSNVGKSSIINAIVSQNKLAKTSGSPGKTKLINHFIINNQWYLVDLPGFGYAKTSKSERKRFQKMTSEYLLNRRNLMCLFVLIDCRLEPQQIDQEFMEWASNNNVPFVILFTKSDKISKTILKKKLRIYKDYMLKRWEKLPELFITSAKKRIGVKNIIHFIKDVNTKFNKSI